VLAPVKSARSNSGGNATNIPSNAHSNRYEGISFRWDTKQKDPGVLFVREDIFDLFEDGKFYLTAQNSNRYSDYNILPLEAHKTDLAKSLGFDFEYRIPKDDWGGGEYKNINQVWIDGNLKQASYTIEKNWFDEEGLRIDDRAALDAALRFNGNNKLGVNSITFRNFEEALNGVRITVTETIPSGWFEQNNKASQTVNNVKWNTNPVFTFNNQKQWANITIEKTWVMLDG